MLLCNSCVVNWEFDCPKKPLLFGARQILWQMTNDTTTTTTFKTFVTKGKFIQILASSAPPLCLFLPIISPPSPAIGPMFGPLKVRSFWALCFSCSFSYFLTPSMRFFSVYRSMVAGVGSQVAMRHPMLRYDTTFLAILNPQLQTSLTCQCH